MEWGIDRLAVLLALLAFIGVGVLAILALRRWERVRIPAVILGTIRESHAAGQHWKVVIEVEESYSLGGRNQALLPPPGAHQTLLIPLEKLPAERPPAGIRVVLVGREVLYPGRMWPEFSVHGIHPLDGGPGGDASHTAHPGTGAAQSGT